MTGKSEVGKQADPAFQQAVGWALRTPSLGVRLHFNLTCGTAISPPECIPSVTGGDGSFSGQRHVWREAEIEVELNHQFNKLVTAEIMPSHLDSHLARLLHHIHHLQEGTTTEIMYHPRYREDDHPLRIAPKAKDGELSALTSPILRYAIRVQSIRLIHFGHVAKVSYVDQ